MITLVWVWLNRYTLNEDMSTKRFSYFRSQWPWPLTSRTQSKLFIVNLRQLSFYKRCCNQQVKITLVTAATLAATVAVNRGQLHACTICWCVTKSTRKPSLWSVHRGTRQRYSDRLRHDYCSSSRFVCCIRTTCLTRCDYNASTPLHRYDFPGRTLNERK